MKTSPRLLRALADSLPGRPPPTPRDREQQTRILQAATALMAKYGRASIKMTDFASAIRMTPATVRRHFTDLDAILGEIILAHLHAIAHAIGQPPPKGCANPKAARRAAYLAITRAAANAHSLLIRQRHLLPPDLLEPIEELHRHIGTLIAGEHAEAARALLDTPSLTAEHIEAMLGTLNEKKESSSFLQERTKKRLSPKPAPRWQPSLPPAYLSPNPL